MVEQGIMKSAKELRNGDLGKISNDRPGYYKWWALESELKKLVKDENFYNYILTKLEVRIIEGRKYYCFYVGVAIKESLRARLNWHINQKHSESSVKSGFLSTLRQSISSLISGNQYDEKTCNEFIDNLQVEYYVVDFPIRSEEAKKYINTKEGELINGKYARLLNIHGNKNLDLKDYRKELMIIRKKSKKLI